MITSNPDCCSRCGAELRPQTDCLRCGSVYTEADVRRLLRDEAWVASDDELFPDVISDLDAKEFRFQLLSVPLALVLAWLMVNAGALRWPVRTFLSMWVHEAGHAVTAWFCGFAALPLPWVTLSSHTRSLVFTLILETVLIGWLVRSWKRGERLGVFAAVALLAVQLSGTFLLAESIAQDLITFSGDGGMFVLGTILMAMTFVPPDDYPHQARLRWGFLVFGAAAFADGFKIWWDSYRDLANLPVGTMAGEVSDATKLINRSNWSASDLIHRYLMLAAVCLIVLFALYFWNLWSLRAARRRRVSTAAEFRSRHLTATGQASRLLGGE